jgi:hypothetical protein
MITCCCSSDECRINGCQRLRQLQGNYVPSTGYAHPMQQHQSMPKCECHECTQYRAFKEPFYTGSKPDGK